MKCSYCQADKTKILHTRKFDTVIIRTRICHTCYCSFQTQEEIHLITPVRITPLKKVK